MDLPAKVFGVIKRKFSIIDIILFSMLKPVRYGLIL